MNQEASSSVRPPTVSAPLVRWDVPSLAGGPPTHLSVSPGCALLFAGPNGAGKSALSYWLSASAGEVAPITRILAHRRLWLSSAGTEMTARDREQMGNNFRSWDSQSESRVRLTGEEQRASRLLYDVIARVNFRNAEIAQLFDAGQLPGGPIPESLLTAIDRVFAQTQLPISFDLTDMSTIDAVRTDTGQRYPISEMSDGEKGAFLLAAEVLLSARDGVLILDEPERHLHRAVSADLALALMKERPDCGFVLLTHDLDLVGRLEPATTTVCTVSDVRWDGGAAGWELTVHPAPGELPDEARQAILGGRSRLLFVEGAANSLDIQLHRLLFPDWSIVPCGGSAEVARAVGGLADAAAYHWADGRGVVDGDARAQDEVAALAAKNVLVLPVNEVESLYYLPCLVAALAGQQAELLGNDAEELERDAYAGALSTLDQRAIRHLAAVNAEKILRRKALSALPARNDLPIVGESIAMEINSPYPEEEGALSGLVASADYEGVVRRYSVRDSGFLGAVSKALGFQSRTQFESAVRVRLARDPGLLAVVRSAVGTLPGGS